MRAFCFATGNLWRLIGKKDIVSLISSLNIDGVEWSFGKNFDERLLIEKDINLLKQFDFNSVHSPFLFSKKYFSKTELTNGLKLMENYSQLLHSKNVVIHPVQVFPENFFDTSKLTFLSENLNPKKGKKRSKNGFEIVLNKFPEWGLCLDVSHAYDWSVEETERIVKKWKHRIKQIHFSNNRYHKDHLPFTKVSKDFLKSIEPLRELNVPFILEEDMPFSSLNEIKQEVKRARVILGF